MIYTKKIKQALIFAYNKHHNQVDKDGVPYIFHPFHLAEQMCDEDSIIVALLHDLIEDTDVTFDELKKMDFSENVLEALKLLTHDKNIDYFSYIYKISSNELAKIVKIQDLKHNIDLNRLSVVTEEDIKRVEKYKKALAILENK